MVSGHFRAIVLAAGKSSRFKRKKNKLATMICGRPMILFLLRELQKLRIPMTMIIGHQGEEIKQEVETSGVANVDYVVQQEQLGTGHAVLCSKHVWDRENILILNGDMPLIEGEFLEAFLNEHTNKNASVSFVSTHVLQPTGYGRVIEENGKIRICEEKDCSDEYLCETRVNAGIYAVKKAFLEEFIATMQRSSVSGEFYITDLIAYASDHGHLVNVMPAPFEQVRGVNTLQELWAVEQIMRSNLIKHWMDRGVRFELAQNIHLDVDVEIGPDSFIGTGAHILGKTKIGEGCFVAAFTILENTIVGDGSNIHSHSVIQDSVIGNDVHVGPFARLRNNVAIADNACVGNFVEVKGSSIGIGSKIKHLAYIGDATVGSNVNIGAGTIVCNYDGQEKHHTKIEDGVFVGSNNTLIAPVTIGKGAYVAAGSTITKDVPSEDLAIARARQENKEGYARKLKDRVKKKRCNFNFVGATKTRGGSEESL